LSRPSYLPSPPTNGRTDARTDGRAPTIQKRAFDRGRQGVWRRRRNTGKKERVCDRRRHRRRRTSFSGDQRKVRASVWVCVCFAPGSSRAFVVVVRFAGFVCAAVLRFSPPSSILQRFASVLTLPCCVVEGPFFKTGSEVVFSLLDRSKGRPIANERAGKRSRQTYRQTER
jgi:hypothetical protein